MLNEQNYFFSFVLNFEENYEGVFDKEFKIFYDKINSRFSNNNFEIVIINNQYNSKSIEYLKDLSKKYSSLKIFFLASKIYYENSFIVGFDNAIGDVVISVDLAKHPLELLEKHINNFLSGYQISVGIQNDILKSRNILKKFFYKAYYKTLSYLSNRKHNYAVSTSKLFTREVVNIFSTRRLEYQFFSSFSDFPGFKCKEVSFDNKFEYKRVENNLVQKFEKAVNLIIKGSDVPLKLVNIFLNTAILLNLIYLIYIFIYTINAGIGSGWTSISTQLSFMFLIVFIVLKILFITINESLVNRSGNKNYIIIDEIVTGTTKNQDNMKIYEE